MRRVATYCDFLQHAAKFCDFLRCDNWLIVKNKKTNHKQLTASTQPLTSPLTTLRGHPLQHHKATQNTSTKTTAKPKGGDRWPRGWCGGSAGRFGCSLADIQLATETVEPSSAPRSARVQKMFTYTIIQVLHFIRTNNKSSKLWIRGGVIPTFYAPPFAYRLHFIFFSACHIFRPFVRWDMEFPEGHLKTNDMATCTVLLTYSLLLVPVLWQVLRSRHNRACPLCHPNDVPFLISGMAMMLGGELTNPFQRVICNSVGKARDFCYAIYHL
jgi:hypothetical protein